jgi:sugar transferase EpsL
MKRHTWQNRVKRFADLVLGGSLLLFAAPFFPLIWLLVRWDLGKPSFFRQQRSGLYTRLFTLYKFRTMTDPRDVGGKLKPDAERLTQLGRFLRLTSIDELPQLWNVLRGDMSLVGPRPLLIEYLGRYTPEQARRHEVKPGITGWAQVNGRNAISWEEKFELDVWYVDHQSFWLDLKILWMTVFKVIRKSDIHADDHVTMPEFRGGSEQHRKAA